MFDHLIVVYNTTDKEQKIYLPAKMKSIFFFGLLKFLEISRPLIMIIHIESIIVQQRIFALFLRCFSCSDGQQPVQCLLFIFCDRNSESNCLFFAYFKINFYFKNENNKYIPKLYKYYISKNDLKNYMKGEGNPAVDVEKDVKGILRFYMNNKPFFFNGVLDQGYWPDGLLTPPSDEALQYDILKLKELNSLLTHSIIFQILVS